MSTNTNTFISFDSEDNYRKICGVNDSYIKIYEKLLGLSIIPRGLSFKFQSSSKKKLEFTKLFFSSLDQFILNMKKGEEVEEWELKNIITELRQQNNKRDFVISGKRIFTTESGQAIFPKNKIQEEFVSICSSNSVVFATGPAGTGKTFLSVVLAARALDKSKVDRIILTRPAVEAGERLGFLPGDMSQKIDPYLRPLFDVLYECFSVEKVQAWMENGKIEVAPLAFMRGRTLSNSYIILDEAQNCSYSQLKMFLTRLGKNSIMLLSGDISQSDLAENKSGFKKVISLLKNINGIKEINFTEKDIVRHALVESIAKALV